MEVEQIVIDYEPRRQFIPFHNRTQRFACIVAHRRAGKTVACIHDLQKDALTSQKERPRCSYIAPSYKQAKTVAWDYLKAAAAPLFKYGAIANEAELRMDYPNGGQVRLFGADNYEALRGMYNDSAVLDEFADFDPRAWPEVIRPTLSDRRGRATFIGSPKGHNQFYDIAKRAQTDPEYYYLVLKASDIVPENDLIPNAEELHLVTSAELASNRKDMSEEQYSQEYECSFEAAIVGSYYGKLMAQAESRITGVAYDAAAQVWTSWDLGIRDATAIWFAQVVGREIHIIDYYEASGADLGHYVREIQSRPYVYAGHIIPHDAEAKELGTGKTRTEVLEALGLKQLTLCRQQRVEDGINAVRVFIPKCWFDAVKCERGIEALKLYRSEYSDKLRTLSPHPVHDWASHAADSFRYLALTLDSQAIKTDFHRKIVYPSLGVA